SRPASAPRRTITLVARRGVVTSPVLSSSPGPGWARSTRSTLAGGRRQPCQLFAAEREGRRAESVVQEPAVDVAAHHRQRGTMHAGEGARVSFAVREPEGVADRVGPGVTLAAHPVDEVSGGERPGERDAMRVE